MQKGSLIVSKNGVECRWRLPVSQVKAMVHTGAIYARGVSRVIVVIRDEGFNGLEIMSHWQLLVHRLSKYWLSLFLRVTLHRLRANISST